MTDETLFTAALEKHSPAERSAFLNEACADDPAMRQRVEALLHAQDKVGDFLERPAVAQMAGGAPSPPDATMALDPAGRPEPASPPTEPGDEQEDAPLDFVLPPTKPGSLGRLGHYEVLEVLGRGGFGIVLKAFDEMLHRVVAVKVMAPRLAATSPARKRFLREARASAAVRHENVVAVYAVEEQPIPYLVMEFIAGETVQQRLDRTGPLDAAEVARIGRQIAEGLAAAHAMGLIHRDVKPSNILLESGADRVKITDFGLARAADDATLTQSGVIAGTPMYMAPEQALGETIDQRADLFSLGSVLYVMCSGRPPFRASTTLAVLKRVAEDAPRPIREIIPEVPEWLCAIIAKLHAKKPEERFASAKEVADLLGRCLAEPQGQGLPALAQKADRPRRDRKPRPRWLVPAGAAVLMACLLLVVFLVVYVQRPSHGEPPADPKAPVVFRVEANRSWQDTGVDVAESEAVVLSPQGSWRKGEQTCSAAGLDGAPRERAVLPEAPLLCLLVRVGDEPAPTPLLKRDVFKPRHGGRLFVQPNDLDLADDSNDLQLTITGGLHTGDTVPPPGPTPAQAADLDWKPFLARVEAPGATPEQVREEVLAYCSKYAGAPQAFRAGQRLLKAPPLVNSIGMKLAPIPPGKFLMGSPEGEKAQGKDELQQEVELTHPFYLGVYDVTVGQFKMFVKETDYQTEAEKGQGAWLFANGSWQSDPLANWQNPGFDQNDDHPVVCVSWNDAKAFCNWLSRKEKRKYQLPTEAQWEYACRAGTTTAYSFGDDPKDLGDYAWYSDNAGWRIHPVGEKKPNPWGLYDMHGNVWQWCQADYGPYPSKDVIDPINTIKGSIDARVSRGGSWDGNAGWCRAAARPGRTPGYRLNNLGLRVCIRLD